MKWFFGVSLLIALHCQLFGHSLRGIVYGEDGEVLAGAHIFNLSKGNNVHANQKGEFFIDNISLGLSLIHI